MSSWREVAASLVGDEPESAGLPHQSQPRGCYGLPEHLERGLMRLAERPPRRVHGDPVVWCAVVADARRIAREGWATKALALGWSSYDLFGIGSSGSDEWLSLSVWLEGRTLTMMDSHRAFTTELGRYGTYRLERWGRRDTTFVEPVHLWEFGR